MRSKKLTPEEEKDIELRYKRSDFLDEQRIKIQQSLDKYIFSFATGALYLSIFFTTRVGTENLTNKNFLGWGWGTLLLAIVATLISVALSAEAFNRQRDITHEEIEDILRGKEVKRENCWNRVVAFLTYVGIVSFIAGVAILARFYFINL